MSETLTPETVQEIRRQYFDGHPTTRTPELCETIELLRAYAATLPVTAGPTPGEEE